MPPIPDITRRDFLKLSAAGALGLLLSELLAGPWSERSRTRARAAGAQQGRVVLSGIGLYETPAFAARKLKVFGRDEVVEITAEVEGDDGNPYNRIWYRLNDEGYTYSGWVQPVETRYNKPTFDIPDSGILGEITVPYSDTRLHPDTRAERGYRLYYRSTHWVIGIEVNEAEKSIWYRIYDFELRASFLVPSHDMRIVPNEELAPLSPDVPEELKYIYVDVGTQLVTAFEDERPVLVARCSSGAKGTRTPLGEFLTYHKGPSVHMSNQGDAVANIYHLPGVPWVSFFTGTGVAFHGTYWHNDFGRPRSRGCVNLDMDASKFIYLWTRPTVPPDTQYLYLPGEGTRVEVVKSTA